MKYVFLANLFLLSVVATSCGQNQAKSHRSADPGVHIEYEYADADGKRLIIQNGYPRGGTRYTGPDGEEYGYAVFWTRIINETDKPVELTIDFSGKPYDVPSLPGKYLRILVPPDTMTIDKVPLFGFGLTELPSFLDTSIYKPTSLKRTINPKESSGFFVVKLSLVSEGATGGGDVLRTGLILKGEDLFYRISTYNSSPARHTPSIIGERDIPCGRINLKTLTLWETTKNGL